MANTISKHIIEVQTKFVTVNGKSMVESKKVVEGLGRGVTQTTTSMRDWDSQGMKMVKTGRTLTKGFQKFQMENLGVMFAGMALNRSMANLNSTSREWLGIGELTSDMMGITMLQANIDLLEFGVIPLFDALTSLPPAAQRAIGLTAIALEGLGAAMMLGGQFMLGLDSTATLLSKIAGVRPELIFTSKGLSALKTKMEPLMTNLGKIGKIAAAGIFIAVAIKDFDEGQFVAALGDVLAAGGIIMGGPGGAALLVVGVSLKLLGDEDFLVDILKTGFKIGTALNSIIKEAVTSAFTLRDFDVDNIEGLGNVSRAFGRAMEEIQQEQAGKGIFDFIAYPENMLDAVEEDIERLDKELKNDIISKEEYLASLEPLVDKQEKILKRWKAAFSENELMKVKAAETPVEQGSFLDVPPVSSQGINIPGILANLFFGNKSKAIGGDVTSDGLHFLHEGETVLRKDQANNQSGNISIVNNISVSDSRELQRMIEVNNQKIIREVRRDAT